MRNTIGLISAAVVTALAALLLMFTDTGPQPGTVDGPAVTTPVATTPAPAPAPASTQERREPGPRPGAGDGNGEAGEPTERLEPGRGGPGMPTLGVQPQR